MLKSGVLVLSLALATAATTGGADAAAGPPGKGWRNIGGVNLNYYCKQTYGAAFKSVLIGNTAGDWVCQTADPHDRRPISVDKACVYQYGARPGIKSAALKWSDPLSWRCFIPAGPHGGGRP